MSYNPYYYQPPQQHEHGHHDHHHSGGGDEDPHYGPTYVDPRYQLQQQQQLEQQQKLSPTQGYYQQQGYDYNQYNYGNNNNNNSPVASTTTTSGYNDQSTSYDSYSYGQGQTNNNNTNNNNSYQGYSPPPQQQQQYDQQQGSYDHIQQGTGYDYQPQQQHQQQYDYSAQQNSTSNQGSYDQYQQSSYLNVPTPDSYASQSPQTGVSPATSSPPQDTAYIHDAYHSSSNSNTTGYGTGTGSGTGTGTGSGYGYDDGQGSHLSQSYYQPTQDLTQSYQQQGSNLAQTYPQSNQTQSYGYGGNNTNSNNNSNLSQSNYQQDQQMENDRINAWNEYYEKQKQYELQQEQQRNKDMEVIAQQQKAEYDKMVAELQKERDEVERKRQELQRQQQQQKATGDQLEAEKQRINIWREEEMRRQMNEVQREREMAKKHEAEMRKKLMEEQALQQLNLNDQAIKLKQQEESIRKKINEEQQLRQKQEQQKQEELRQKESGLLKKVEEIENLSKRLEEEKRRREQEANNEKSLAVSRRDEVAKQEAEINKRKLEMEKEKKALEAMRLEDQKRNEAHKKEVERMRQQDAQQLKLQQESIKREQDMLDIQKKELKLQARESTGPSSSTIDSLQPMRDMVTVLAGQKALSPPPVAIARESPPAPTRPKPRFPPVDMTKVVNGYKLGDVVKIQRCYRKYVMRRKFKEIVQQALHSTDHETESSKKRFRAVNEVYSTEVSYLNSLLVLQNFYFIPMEVEARVTKLFKVEEIGRIFSNLKSLLQISTDFHHQLEERLHHFPILVGDVFLKFAPIFKIYVEYINNFDNVHPIVKTLMESPQGANFFNQQKQKSRVNTDLQSLLIMPIQRIPRYELLLREILGNTPESHVEYKSIKTAYESMKKINQYINERKTNVDRRTRLSDVQKEIKNAPELIASHRYFVRDGECVISSTKKHETGNYHMHFFNDLLLVSKKTSFFSSYKYEFLYSISLKDADVRDIETNDAMVRVVKGRLDSLDVVIYTLCFTSKKEKDLWLADLAKEIGSMNKTIQSMSSMDLKLSMRS
ncbi:hypothetical protein SAMD00019534_092760 [Acytostelium subglobosum LB1]|uniref:hypothetical protein n=1 Tax=Acytostelium subglobosum LB1 TaxID=1410327 RepID=UPI000645099B|nr:hypothetical protein SAMD00019534_092760 [Acytostelium subglobosum LB1]GAM26101.1 hypothetical protein SAMD00019534_092760 [Acytostelium subglobosum LB1]|eukprot:XP_012751144.1 hypothetical protein SAMD00019534_092760 [Acytostelium subglobosum LB1]